MPKKSAALKSKPAPKSKSVAVNWTIQSVGELLDAVNRETLGRLERKIDAIKTEVDAIADRCKSIQTFDVPAIEQNISAVFDMQNNQILPKVEAIRKKVGA